MGSGYACTEESISIGTKTASLGFCAKKCTRTADCGTDVCQAVSNDSFNRVDVVCGPADATALGTGAACTTSDQCASGMCVTFGSGSTAVTKCSALCVTATDCGGGLTKCGKITFTLSMGVTQTVNACTP